MPRKKNPRVGRSLQDFVAEQRSKDAEFATEWDSRQIARRVRELRESKHLTQEQLAARVKTTQSAIARLESGKVMPRLDLLQRIAAAMGLYLTVDLSARRAKPA